MKAAVLTAINAPLEIAEVWPDELQYGQVLVRVLASGICGAQLQEIRGEKGNAKHLPHLLGHEGAGMVEKVGLGVARVKPGDKVVMHWRQGRGIESPFPQYIFRGDFITSGRVTTLSEYSICSENRLTPVPVDTPTDLCALLGCGLSTALATIETEAQIKMGESLLIIGCGGLGANMIRAARMRSVTPITVCDVREEKEPLAMSLGADRFARGMNLKGAYDVIIDTAGSGQMMTFALRHLAPSGRYIMLGQPRDEVGISQPFHMFEGTGKTIKATQGGGFMPSDDIPRYVTLYRSGLLKLDGIITHRLKLDDVNKGVDLVRNGQASRVLIEM